MILEDKLTNKVPEINRYRILFLSNRNPYPVVDGQSRRTYNILKGLALNHDVHFLSLFEPHEKINSSILNHLKSFCSEVDFLPCPPKSLSYPMLLRLIRSIFSRYPYTVWRHYSADYYKRIQVLIAQKRFDLIHCDCLPLATTIKGIHKIPTVLTDHDVSYLKSFRMAKQTPNIFLKGFLYLESFKVRCFEKNIFKFFDLGITVSKFDLKILQRLCPETHWEVVENGVDTQEFKPSGNATEGHSLLWLGGFKHYPNFEAMRHFLKNIYPSIKGQTKNVQLNIIGGEIPLELKQLSQHDPSVNLLGFMEDPSPYFANASVFICPILSGSGTRLKILEAMAMGKAIVSTIVGIEGIEGFNGKHFLVSDTPQSFADNVIAILQNKVIQKELGKNARILAEEKYDWRIIWEKNESLYSQLIKSFSKKSTKY